ncbi:MAG: hypothetical protein RLZZ126_341 [Pseudomonadota bacterium]|jgi:probable O-glycosylation ligase (exosortase A-associated)
MRDLLFLAFVVVCAGYATRNTLSAYFMWSWTGLLSITTYLYGSAAGYPYVAIFAAITLVRVLVTKEVVLDRLFDGVTAKLLALFAGHALLVAIFAYPDLSRNWELATNILKTVLFCLLMPFLLSTRTRIQAFVLVFASVLVFSGMIDGLKFLSSGGGHLAPGIAKYGDNNHYASILCMGLPLCIYVATQTKSQWVKLGFLAVSFLVILAVLATRSRGGFAGLLAIALWLIVLSDRKILGVLLVAAGGVLILYFAPDGWADRMNTIESADQDASFMGRVGAWKVSSAIAIANPVFGGGFRAVQALPVWLQFQDATSLPFFSNIATIGKGKAAHSIWFEVLGDMGFVGLIIFVTLIGNAFVNLLSIKALVRQIGASAQWAGSLANMLGASLFAFVVTGSLLSSAYFEMNYSVIALLAVLKLYLTKQVDALRR